MHREPIAIVGIGCRFPQANNPREFWQLIKNGKDAISEVPPSRWDIQQFYDADPTQPGKTHTRWGGFLENIDQFDPQFFGISPREAVTMDPQQRLLLEVAWEALEDGGQRPEDLAGTQVGVFIGIGTHDYSIYLWQDPVSEPYATTGTGNCIAANRISYIFNFKGPSLAIDTACSSSLVATHLACQSLWQGESTVALAGGVNILLLPTVTVGFSKGGFMSPTGRCQSFDAAADGYVRSEGAGVVVLKPLSQAEADGDRIYAIIRGTAVNQDGFSNGLAAPNPDAQEAVLRAAYRHAGVSPADIQYIEAHGTGTQVGDKVELEALGRVLKAGRSSENPCLIGSVKTNIGHTETTAGIAGLIKTALALYHQQIPPSLHFKHPNPAIPFDQLPVKIQTNLTLWNSSKPLIAGVNSFGFGGTNAHVVLEGVGSGEWGVGNDIERQQATGNGQQKSRRKLHLFTISAKNKSALQQLGQNYAEFIAIHPELSLTDICFTTNTRRTHFNHRLAIVSHSTEELQQKLTSLETERTDIYISPENPSKKIAFLFTGQGSQYYNMGRELYETQPIFKEYLDYCAELLETELEEPLLEVIYSENKSDLLDQTAYTQPALFAIEYTLAQLWMSWGIQPEAVLGHSIGEYVAACIAGVFSLEDGLKLVAARGKLMQQLPQNGAMVAVMAEVEIIQNILKLYSSQVAIAAYNGQNIVISGYKEAISEITTQLNIKEIKNTPLQVSHGFHSPLMQPILEEFYQIANQVQYHIPKLPIISNVTGTIVKQEIATADYWCRHIIEPVQFKNGLKTLIKNNYNILLECGAKPILTGMARGIYSTQNYPQLLLLPSLRPEQSNTQQILQTLAKLYIQGIAINWSKFYQNYPDKLQPISLPNYPFQRQRFWWDRKQHNYHISSLSHHPLLGEKIRLAGSQEILFQAEINSKNPNYLQDHRIGKQIIFPATGYLESVLAAGKTIFKTDNLQITSFEILQPLKLIENQNTIIQTILKAKTATEYDWQIYSLIEDRETLHATGSIQSHSQSSSISPDLDILKYQCNLSLDLESYYKQLRSKGLNYGENFQAIKQLWQGDKQAFGKIKLRDSLKIESTNYQIHPVLLDACLQMLGVTIIESHQTYLPIGLENIRTYRCTNHQIWSWVKLQDNDNPNLLKADIILWDEAGVIAKIEGLSLKSINLKLSTLSLSNPLASNCYQISWQPKEIESSSSVPPQHSLIITDASRYGDQLATLLTEQGHTITLIPPEPNLFDDYLSHSEILDNIIYCGSLEYSKTLEIAQKSGCGFILKIIQYISQTQWQKMPRLWLLTQKTQAVFPREYLNVEQTSIWGLSRTINLEHPNLGCTCIDLEDKNSLSLLLQDIQTSTQEKQIAYRNGKRYVARFVPYIVPNSLQPYQLRINRYGLDQLKLVPLTRRPPAAGEVEIQIVAAGLNFRDVLNALGMLQEYLEEMGLTDASEIPFGGECSGRVTAVGVGVSQFQVGDAVIAAQAIGSLASFITVNANFVTHKPKPLSFVEAATLPTTFLTAYYGLIKLAKIQPGERILIHSAAGGVGQAALQLALWKGAEVYATASPRKWNFLKSQGVKAVMNSRTLDFATEVMQLTEGKGINIVLNSLNGDFIPKSLDVLAKDGRFVEIGKIGILSTEKVQQYRPDIDYFSFDLLEVSTQKPDSITQLFNELIPLFNQKQLNPLPHQVFPIEQAQTAFRYMAQAQHIGKVVLTLPPQFKHNNPISVSYLITGGLGALGLQVARWLVEEYQAKYLILVGRRSPSKLAQKTIESLEKMGANIEIIQADVSDEEAVKNIIANSNNLTGIIHAAGILEDGVLAQMSWQQFWQVMQPKVLGAWNLHQQTQHLDLDCFICFSSIAATLGSPGQGNYAAANAFLDGLMHYRQSQGLPGLSLNWGLWEIGMVTQLNTAERSRLNHQGLRTIAPNQGLTCLSQILEQNTTQVSVFPVDWTKFIEQLPSNYFNPFFEKIKQSKKTKKSIEKTTNFNPKLPCNSAQFTQESLIEYIREKVAKVLGFSSTDAITPQENFADLGMDSLMATELKNSLESSLNCSIPLTLAFDYPTVEALANYLMDSSLVACSPSSETKITDSVHLSTEEIEEIKSNNLTPTPHSPLPTPSPNKEIITHPEFYQFSQMKDYVNLKQDLERAEALGNPFLNLYQGTAKNTIQFDNQELIHYSGYNYLGLSGHPTINAAAQAAINEYGTSVSASRVLSGERPIHRQLEQEIADFIGTEDCIAFIGGHATNVTTIGHLFGEKDLVICDAAAHNSIREGCKLSGAMQMEFSHNNWQELEQILHQHRYQYEKVLIAIEGIYSADGDIANLPEIIQIKQYYKALLMVDEAHSIGVLGTHGKGISEYFNINPNDVDIWMGTLSKSLASCGGYIAGNRELIEYLKYTAPGFVFSVGMSPANTAAALAALQLLKAEPERVTQLHQRSQHFLNLAQQKGLNTGMSQNSPIIPIIVGEPAKAVQLSQQLLQVGINVQPMVYPSVPYEAARLRFFLTCLHTPEQIQFTLEHLWPGNRRVSS